MKLFWALSTLLLTAFSLLVVYLFVVNVEENRGNLRPKKDEDIKPLLGVVYGRRDA